jgi:hypothetical protein
MRFDCIPILEIGILKAQAAWSRQEAMMVPTRVSVMRYQPVPEKEQDFWNWYEKVHTPDLFTRPSWKRVRMCRLAPEQNLSAFWRPYRDSTGQPRYLNLLERYADAPVPWSGPGPSPGQVDMVENWLPTLAKYSTAGYLNVLEKTAEEFGGSPERKGPYRIGLMSYDVVPEKEAAFHQWYDEVHIPELFAGQGWRAVRRYAFSAEKRTGPEILQSYQLREGQPAHLILLERDVTPSAPPTGRPAGEMSHGQQDFVNNWLPYLKNYTSYGYECLVDASDKDFK